MAQEQTATNPATGEVLALRNGQWVPIDQPAEAPLTATNPQTGETVVLQDGRWVPLGESRDNGIYPQMRPGFSQENPIDLSTALTTGGMTRDDLLALQKGTWVKFQDGRVVQIEQPTSGQREGDVEIAPGVVAPKQVGSGEDVVRSFPTGVAQGLAGLVGLPRLLNDAGTSAFDALFPNNPGARLEREDPETAARIEGARTGLLPSTGEVNQGIQSVIGQYHQPQTTAGEYSRTVGEFVPNAIAPGGAVRKAASVVVPGLLSEGLGQAGRYVDERYDGPDTEGALRFAGGLGGSLATGIRTGGGAENVIRNATRDVTPEQLALSQALQARSPVPLTNAESLQSVTGGATGLGRLQRVVEGSNNRLGPMMADRPSQTEQALANVLDQIAPPTSAPDVASRAQGAAEGVLNTMRGRVNESAQPIYDRLPGQTLDPADAATLMANPSYARASEELTGNPELAALLSGGPDDLSTVNRVIQQLDTLESQARPSVMNPQGNNTLAAQRSDAAALARQLASDTSPDFALARQTVATGREAFVDPLRAGPVGRIAGQSDVTPDLGAQTNALFPTQPFEGQPEETVRALRLMGEVDPSAPQSLVRQYLARQAAEGMQQNVAGPNQFGGAKFAAQTFGNPLQESAVMGAIDAVAPTAAPDTRDLVAALRATGMRETTGSNTAFNTQIARDMSGGNIAQNLAAGVANPTGIFGRIGRGVDDFTARRNAEKVAEILLSDPQTFSRIVQSTNQPAGLRARLATALGASQQE